MVFGRQQNDTLTPTSGRDMHRAWTVLLLAIGALSSGQSLAFPVASDHCDPSYIRSQLEATGTFPKLRGCDPNVVRNALGDSRYRFQIENRHSSNSIAAGLITTQRVQSYTVYVTVSTGPDEPGAGQHQPGLGGLIGQVIVGALQHPPQTHQQPTQPPVVQVQPQPPQPAPVPPVVEPAPTPAPPVEIAQAVQPVTPPPDGPAPAAHQFGPKHPPKSAQTPKSVSPKPAPAPQHATPPAAPAAPQHPPAAPTIAKPPPPLAPPSFPRFSITGSYRITEGDDLEVQIRRERSDHQLHRLILSYSDPSLLESGTTTIDYGADLPDVIMQKVPTRVNPKHDGDHDLGVTLVSAENARVGNPDSVFVVIADLKELSWWDKLKLFLASFPTWAIALAGAAFVAAAGLGITRFILPRATCSIGSGRPTLGPIPLRTVWPALHVDTSLGGASFSIPHPLPRGANAHAEPSPV